MIIVIIVEKPRQNVYFFFGQSLPGYPLGLDVFYNACNALASANASGNHTIFLIKPFHVV